ncbi:MAG TPA: rhomboid family intramembrane serine protease [Candidatus Angelobacter sp.]|nr:rhomboid family intramembrane serine protease [Candidatus Angelobacter sp.]
MPAQRSIASKPALATYALLAINIIIFIVMLAFGVPFVDPKGADVLPWGADYGPYTLGGQYWRLITAMFLHFGIIHLAGNMWCLFSLGQLTEKLLGSISVLGLYLLTGIGASLLSLSWDPMRVSAGASGAIFGIAGALISVLYFAQLGLQPEGRRRLLGYVVRFAFLNLIFGLTAHIDNMAHLGGLVSGLLIGFFLALTFKLAPEGRPTRRFLIFAISALILLGLFVPVVRTGQYAVEFEKGQTALEHHDPRAAIPHLQKYVAARPKDAFGRQLLQSVLQEIQRLDQAIPEYERALALDPNNAYVQVNLAKLYASQNETDKALQLFKKGMPRAEPDALAFYWYASTLKDSGRVPEAESNIRRSIELDPKNADAHALLADILSSEGRKAEAKVEFERADRLSK